MLNANHSLLGRKSLFVVLFEVWWRGETRTFESRLAKPRHIVNLTGAMSTSAHWLQLNRPSLVDPSLESAWYFPQTVASMLSLKYYQQVLNTAVERKSFSAPLPENVAGAWIRDLSYYDLLAIINGRDHFFCPAGLIWKYYRHIYSNGTFPGSGFGEKQVYNKNHSDGWCWLVRTCDVIKNSPYPNSPWGSFHC